MKILIASANQQVINDLNGKPVKFQESTRNTSTFNVSPKKFQALYKEAKTMGYNPYALMSW